MSRYGNMSEDEVYMRRALAVAQQGAETPGAEAIGCVIVRDGAVVAEGHNECGLRHDPTAHAEIVTIRRACQALSAEDLRGATLYSTLQPCGMCTMAVIWSKIGRVVFGAGRDDVHRMYFEDRHLDTADFIKDAFRDDLSMAGGVLKDACAALYVGPDEHVPEQQQVNL